MLGLSIAFKILDAVQTPPVFVEDRLCSRNRLRTSCCRLCIDTCPASAIRIGTGVTIDEARCTGCGACIAACPNGAFWSERKGDEQLAKEMTRLLSGGPSIMRIRCQKCAASAEPEMVLPCLGRLTESLLLTPFALGIGEVHLLRPDCLGCTNETAVGNLDRTISLASELARLVGLRGEAIQQIRAQRRDSTGQPFSKPTVTSRRGLFGLARTEAAALGATLLPPERGEQADQRLSRPASRKRAFLLKLLRTFNDYVAADIDPKGLGLGAIEIGGECIGCNVCEKLCPASALSRVEQGDHMSIFFKAHLCTGCGVCLECCLFDAIKFRDRFPLEALVVQTQSLLVSLNKTGCASCGQPCWCTDAPLCPSCRLEAKRN